MRSVRMATLFGVLSALVGAVVSTSAGPIALFGAWVALNLAAVSVAYAGAARVVFLKDGATGKLAWHRKVLLLPYLLLTWSLWHVVRVASRERPFAELVPGLIIGRRLCLHEYPADVRAVVDLTHEFEAQRPRGTMIDYVNMPVLDGAAPTADQLMRISERVMGLERPVYLHCALGHGRTATVAAAVLITLGRASSAEEALARVASVRKGAQPNREQRKALAAFSRLLPTSGAIESK